jgi:hypothetical protein
MNLKPLALAATLSLAIATPAFAAPSAGLAIGGNTIAGPGALSLAPGLSGIIYTNASGDTDACTTIVNGGRGAVRVTVTGSGSGTIDVAAAATGALCRDDVSEIELLCLGVAPNSCSVQWRVDRD